jgi:hypothetical protein
LREDQKARETQGIDGSFQLSTLPIDALSLPHIQPRQQPVVFLVGILPLDEIPGVEPQP